MGTTQPKIYNFDFHFGEEGEAPPPFFGCLNENAKRQYDIYLDKDHNKKSLKISGDIYNFNFFPRNIDNNDKNANNDEKSNILPINDFIHNIDPNSSQSVYLNNNKKKIF